MPRIGICHFRVGLTDGVSLEIEKWKNVLEEIGHKVYLLTGETHNIDATIIPELRLNHPKIKKIYRNSFQFLSNFTSEDRFFQEINKIVCKIETKIYSFVRKFSIEILDVENVWSLPINIPAAIALYRVVKSTGINAISHHHDFFWERSHFDYPTCRIVKEILDTYFPPQDKLIKHTVINSIAQHELKTRRGINSVVIPNVFDFEKSNWKIDEYNYDFRKVLGLRKKDIVILQATRIVPRKGIELAIDLVKELSNHENLLLLKEKRFYDKKRRIDDKSKIVLVFPNLIEDLEYYQLLKEKLRREKIKGFFINDRVNTMRRMENNKKIYSLWDTYLFADLITYPSLYEGWGNQFLEAINAKLPIVIFEYEVFKSDIKSHGFKVISLGDKIIGKDDQGLYRVEPSMVKKVSKKVIRVLTDLSFREKMVNYNFQLGERLYSTQALRNYLKPIFSEK